MNNETLTMPKNGRSRFEAFFNAFIENFESEIEKREQEVQKYRQDIEYWMEQFAREKTEKERIKQEREQQLHLLRTLLSATNPVAACQGV